MSITLLSLHEVDADNLVTQYETLENITKAFASKGRKRRVIEDTLKLLGSIITRINEYEQYEQSIRREREGTAPRGDGGPLDPKGLGGQDRPGGETVSLADSRGIIDEVVDWPFRGEVKVE